MSSIKSDLRQVPLFIVIPMLILAAGICLSRAALAQGSWQDASTLASPLGQGSASMHVSLGIGTASGADVPGPYSENPAPNVASPRFTEMAPTRSSFLAVWGDIEGATGYQLDVSTSRSFDSYVNNYHNREVGNVTTWIVFGLDPGTTYYYRVRGVGSFGISVHSETKSVTTPNASGLVINPTFDVSITGNPNAAQIQGMINQAVAAYQALFGDQVTVAILFRYANTDPISGDPIDAIGQSYSWGYQFPWSTYINALLADAKTNNDATANATLPGTPLSTNMRVNSALGRAIGLNTSGGLMVGGQGPFDGVVTLNSGQPIQFTRPPSPNSYDALRTTEHEIDEVIGLGSFLNQGAQNVQPQDLFSWSSPGVRNLTSNGTRYFSIDAGNTNIVGFNQNGNGDYGDWISPACPQANPYVQNAFSCTGQVDDVTATSPEGINLDVIGWDLRTTGPTPTPPGPTPTPGGNTALGNLSTRLVIQTGDNALIGGIIVSGTQPKPVILRAIGPSLPLPGVISDPTLELRNSAGTLLAFNDDWMFRQDGSSQEAEVQATGIAPTHIRESALVGTLGAGAAYTLVVRGYQNATGTGVVEAYDLDRNVDSRLANISTRGFVQTGNDVMIGGTIVVGNGSATILFRAIGPSLAAAGVPNPMLDTTLELRDSNGGLVESNDDWKIRDSDGTSQQATIAATGIPPTNDLESAILRVLVPGAYTAVLRGYHDSIGVALVEAYKLQ